MEHKQFLQLFTEANLFVILLKENENPLNGQNNRTPTLIYLAALKDAAVCPYCERMNMKRKYLKYEVLYDSAQNIKSNMY